MSEKQGKSKKKEVLFTAAVMVLAALAIGLVMMFQQNVDTITLSDGAWQYFGERKLEYSGTCRLSYKDGTATLTDDNGEHELDSKPLYTSYQELVIPVAYVWNDSASRKIYRLEHFSYVKNNGNSICLEDGSKSAEGARGFLYDGRDTYIFLEGVELSVGEETVRLPAMSYVVARYGNTLQYYACGSDESVVINCGEASQLANFSNGDELNMGTDTLYLANGTWQLLVVSPEILDRMD